MSKKESKYELFPDVFANKEQREAIDATIEFLKSPIKDTRDSFTLIGKGGTGKTTIIKKVVEEVAVSHTYVMAAAPSHAAKNVLKDSLGSTVDEVHTIASILGMKLNVNKGVFEIDEFSRRQFGIPIETADIIIIDECSMVGEDLTVLIKEHKSPHCKVVYLGDYHQLPPIRPGDDGLFRDKNSPTFDCALSAELRERMRQEKESPIIPITDVYADSIEAIDSNSFYNSIPLQAEHRKTIYDREKDEGVIFTKNTPQAIYNLSLDLQKEEAKEDLNYARALVYTNQARNYINKEVRKHIWGEEEEKKQYVIGERVISFTSFALSNGKVVTHNSDIYSVEGVREGIHKKGYKILKLKLKTINGNFIEVPVISKESIFEFKDALNLLLSSHKYKKYYELLNSVADIQYAYAITSHKSQGSTYRNAYVFEDNIMDVRATTPKTKFQSLYVATSRPRKKLIIVSKHN